MRKIAILLCVWLALAGSRGMAQAPAEFLRKRPPSPKTKIVKIAYTNPLDNSAGEALLEVPANTSGPLTLIVTPNAANWTQEMNRSLWAGVADELGVLILYPTHQGKTNPRVTLGSPRQMNNLEAAIEAVEKTHPVDKSRVYAVGISQGATESLLLVGRHPERFSGVIAINPVVDFAALYADSAAFQPLLKAECGGTPETVPAAYEERSPLHFARQIARVPAILYWADNDELIPHGPDRQGGALCAAMRMPRALRLKEIRHSNGHGFPFYRVDAATKTLEIYSRESFMGSVQEMLRFHRPAPHD